MLLRIEPRSEFGSISTLTSMLDQRVQHDFPVRLQNTNVLHAITSDMVGVHLLASQYLAECALFSSSVDGETTRTYGEALVEWLNHLSERNIAIEDVTEFDLLSYRNGLATSKNKDQQPFSDQTISLRVRSPMRFHRWAFSTQLQHSPLGEWAMVSRMQINRSDELLVPIVRRIPKILSGDELHALFSVANWPFSLMFKFAIVTGLRRFELCKFKLSQLPSLAEISNSEKSIMTFEIRRKGGRRRQVFAPKRFLEDLHWYIQTQRSAPSHGFDDYLFLTVTGKPIDKHILSNEFRAAADHIGSKAVLHHLRHTYAVVTLTLLQRRADAGESINPLKTLQVLMGHASSESTEIYLQALDLNNDAVEEALDFLYGATL